MKHDQGHETAAELRARIAKEVPRLRKRQQEKARLEAIGERILRRKAATVAWLKSPASYGYRVAKRKADSEAIRARNAQDRRR
jgi:hypothetical protein